MTKDEGGNFEAVVACGLLAGIFLIGLLHLWVSLRAVQLDEAAGLNYEKSRQSERRVQTPGVRGEIRDRRGRVLAGNRQTISVVCDPAAFQRKTWEGTVDAITAAVERAGVALGLAGRPERRSVARHVKQSLAMPIVVWRDIDAETIARVCERTEEFAGFRCEETTERTYPRGRLAAHLLGYVGRDRGESEAGDERYSFAQPELRGRAGIELYYDSFLRGVNGERRIQVDARGFAIRSWDVVRPGKGPDLTLAIDLDIQREAERELRGLRGACVVLDARDGSVLAAVSAPGYDLNDFVPTLSHEVYDRLANDPSKPLLNRAFGGAYAPGSTFKPVMSLAALAAGENPDAEYECCGVYSCGDMRLRCSSRWGHGPIAMREALEKSCNTYFCQIANRIGTNAIFRAAAELGLGRKTGIDFGIDMAGAVPDAAWKESMYRTPWYTGDLVQMSIGQGMLLASPLQMARLVAAIGTGTLVTPHLKAGAAIRGEKLSFPEEHLRVVREGMRQVVDGGTGRRGAKGVKAWVIGKTGTAEVGSKANRRKNTWFVAYAEDCGFDADGKTTRIENPACRLAVAMVIENGETGGGTTAPKVRNILASIFGETKEAES